MHPVSLAFVWHQHQPYYPDDVTGETLMPWVRLHGTKDYWGMAMHLREVPEFRCTINLVPSLLVQLQRYTERGGSDRHLDVSRMPADGLSEADAVYLLNHFFMANADNMIRPYPRYAELFQKRGSQSEPATSALLRFSTADLRDLQVWNNLTWFHPLAFEVDTELAEFLKQGKRWTEEQKLWLLERQIELLREIIPLHKELADRGQVELTTTPFYHPILPLLWDKRSARQAMPGCELPRNLDPYREDALVHLQRAVDFHRNLFGEAPRGMWPSEGSVSQEILAAVASVGIQWIATDEEILAHSTEGFVSRDPHGHLRRPEMLYRPWQVDAGGMPLQIIFRDHGLSDLVGFHYQRSDPHRAAEDLLGRLQGIRRVVEPQSGGRPAIVPIILDGENCWEYYPDGGVVFLRHLYREAVARPDVRPVRVRDHLEAYPATDRITRLFAGSWISHNFSIWIGHREDNTAWDCVHMTRERLKAVQAAGEVAPESLRRAWEELYIAEGSDWYWWFGDDHSSAQDDLFDELFRRHLQNACKLIGDPVPGVLYQPITRAERRQIHSQPRGLLPVHIDGRQTFFEWLLAGHYVAGSERGTMTLVSEGPLEEMHFGFDRERLLLRLDTAGPAREVISPRDELRMRFSAPEGLELRVAGLGEARIAATLRQNKKSTGAAEVAVAVGQILELSVPMSLLGVKAGDPLQFFVEILRDGSSLDRVPREGTIELSVPVPDFERILWQV
jgi:alpha-amylase/alpha-mannosidase (GH57 family)